jgi:hypothetical protein
MASLSEPSRKWGREEDNDDERCFHRFIEEGKALAPEKLEEVPPPPPEEALSRSP